MDGLNVIRKAGDHVIASLRSWEGPLRAGDKGRYVWTGPVRFPRDQGTVDSWGQRHARAYDDAGKVAACVSQSVSYWKPLERLLKWTLRK